MPRPEGGAELEGACTGLCELLVQFSRMLQAEGHQVAILAMVGVFIPWKLASATDWAFVFPGELDVKHLPAHTALQGKS